MMYRSVYCDYGIENAAWALANSTMAIIHINIAFNTSYSVIEHMDPDCRNCAIRSCRSGRIVLN